tara:strand:+ start:124 stop:390 length:267 start_codon:yes stop_codon:yes gene_type:complete
MNNLIVKQILSQKGIPEEIEWEIIQYLPLLKQVKLKKEMILKLNILYENYWTAMQQCWPEWWKSRPPRLRTYKYWRDYNEDLIRNHRE